MQKIFEGVATALVTPFHKDKVDYKSFRNLINRQIKMGVDALVILGTTGEISTLSTKERHEIIDFALKVNEDHVPLIFGIGGNDPSNIIELGTYVAKTSKKLLCKKVGIMVTAPYYNKTTQAGLLAYYKKITNTIKLPTIVYNVPGRTALNIAPETLAQICQLRYVAGIKEASGDITQITQTVKLCPHTAVYCGDDTIALPAYAVGCRGIISVASNLEVTPVKNIYTFYKSGEHQKALGLFQSQLDFYKSLFRAVNPIPVKHELAQMGLIKNALRLPLVPLEWYN